MSINSKLKEMVTEANRLKEAYVREYENGNDERAMEIEKHYLQERAKIIDIVTLEVKKRKSVSFDVIEREVDAMPKPIPRATGIRSLDYELVSEEDRKHQKIGGFPLGNFIQIAGSRGAGKTSIMLKIISGFSTGEPVGWFDFEIGKIASRQKMKQFEYNSKNLLYYNGSRLLEDVIGEIKLLFADGVKHFVIDSNMKLRVPEAYSEVNKNSIISDTLSELTSSLNINIYLINQVSQDSDRTGTLHIKGGNDGEYDADFILFVIRQKLYDDKKNLVIDKAGLPTYNDSSRLIKCVKNRPYEREFVVEVPKDEIFTKPVEIIYEGLAS